MAGIVFSVGDHEQNLFLQFGVFLEVVGRGHHRVVQRGSSPRFHLLQGLTQLAGVTGEVLVQVILVVEIHYEDLILRIAGTHQVQGSFVYLVALFPHGAGIVDHDSHGYGNILMPEVRDGLRLAILEHRKSILLQVRDQVLFVVNYRGVQHHFIDFRVENKPTGLGFGRRRRWRLSLRSGRRRDRLAARLCSTG